MATATNEPLLRVEDLQIQYSDLDVVKGVSFSLDYGSILGIIGESGCGKTTLIKAILNMLEHKGSITQG
ncbi:MAG: ATP-binding cassette domain-containing protein, partial [Bacillota bacterium]|nr:ATP-binding cassette domain-containing protein [Bacillota bacterium]